MLSIGDPGVSMKRRYPLLFAALLLLLIVVPGHAGVDITMGASWQGGPDRLQTIIDAAYGPGRIRVETDYVGARDGDPDPMIWYSSVWPILQVREISGDAHRADLGWYVEAGDDRAPVIDGREDGPVFKNGNAGPSTSVINFRVRGRRIGFYLESRNAGSAQGPRTFFTNRRFNDLGPGGTGAIHPPMEGGDAQALVFDVSPWTRPHTWLVCFEDRDSGALPGPCCGGTDNDYADYVFEVRAESATPSVSASFGTLKTIYR
jgi:hypothetical protein